MESSLKNRIRKVIFDRCNGSNKQFAELIAVGVSTINLWDDDHLPKGDILQRIHTILNVNLHWLLTGKGYPYTDMDRGEERGGECIEWGRSDMLPSVSHFSEAPVNASEIERFPASRILPEASLGQARDMFFRILASGDKEITQAFLTNLRAYCGLVENKSPQADRFTRLEQECEELREKLAQIDDFLSSKANAVGG